MVTEVVVRVKMRDPVDLVLECSSADLVNGLLRVAVKRIVPDALKPRRIAIGATSATLSGPANDGTKTLDAKAA